jgi:hypothetical protein
MNEAQVTDSLSRLGFSQDCIVETILITENQDGSFNAAPMGVTRNDATLVVQPFKTSQTYKNLMRGEPVSINISNDPLLFLATAFKNEVDDQPIIDETGMRGAEAVIHSEIIGLLNESELRATFSLIPKDVVIKSPYPSVFRRGSSKAIEAIIHVTRIQVFHNQSHDTKVLKLKEKVKDNLNVIKKVSSEGSPESLTAKKLLFLMEKWGVAI